ncbi:MAG: TonB-dependent receptor [Sphingobium sp.]
MTATAGHRAARAPYHRLAIGGALAIVLASPAWAQSGTDPADIIVTAQKRAQSLNNVPIAITAVSGEKLVELGITDTRDLVRIEPSFKFSQSTYGTAIYTIRGVGFNDYSLNASPTVSVYTDEVPFSYPSFTKAASLDLERVEVIKGPQGILFGQNSTGGAINNIAAKPTNTMTAGFDGSMERFARGDISGFVSGPLSDTVRFRVAAGYTFGGAWQRSYSRDETAGDADLLRGRAQLEMDASERLRIRLTVGGYIDKSETQAPHLVGIYLNRDPSRPQIPEVLAYPLAPAGDNRAADWNIARPGRNDEWFVQPSARIEYDISDDVQLTSITAYAHFRDKGYRANDGMALSNNEADFDQKNKSFYQELRLSGQTFDNRLDWMLGGQYSTEDTDIDFERYYTESSPAYGSNPPFKGGGAKHFEKIKTWAAFGNLDIHLTDQITARLGARYTDYSIDHEGCSYDTDGNLSKLYGLILGVPIAPGACVSARRDFTPGMVPSRLDDNNLSWRVGLDWKPNNDTLLYASVTRGYKAGVIQSGSVTTYLSVEPVAAEQVTAYEIGLKAGLFDRKLQANAAIFHYDYVDKQFQGRDPDPLGVFGNLIRLVAVPKSRLTGAELSLSARPVDGLTLSGGLTYLKSKVTSDYNNFDSYGRPLNFKGSRFPFTPEWSLSGDIDYRTPIGGTMTGFAGVSATYQSGTVSAFGGKSRDAETAPPFVKGSTRLVIPGYALLDARIGMELNDGQYRFMLFGRNITNKYYITDLVYQNDTIASRTGKPAIYGVSASLRF